MASSLHLFSNTITGYGPPDGCLTCSRVSGGAVSISPTTSRGDTKVNSDIKFLSFKYASRSRPPACNASSGRHNRNPDFSKQNKSGYYRNRNLYNGDSKHLEESDLVSSRNGPLGPSHSDSRNPKYQETSAPGPREREILQLFRNVQAKIREKSEGKEKKTVVPTGKSKEEESVDSILKLLRRHTFQQTKKNSNDDSSRHSVLNQDMQENGAVPANRRTNTINPNNRVKHEMQESQRQHVSRPASNFSKRSPVPRVKFPPAYSDEDSISREEKKEMVSNTELDLEPTFTVEDVFDHMPVEEDSDVFTSDNDEDEEQEEENTITADLSEMKLSELRALAKTRGLKRYSKMKKQDLIELLS